MKPTPTDSNLTKAINCVVESYQTEIGHLQGDDLKEIPKLNAERDSVVNTLKDVREFLRLLRQASVKRKQLRAMHERL